MLVLMDTVRISVKNSIRKNLFETNSTYFKILSECPDHPPEGDTEPFWDSGTLPDDLPFVEETKISTPVLITCNVTLRENRRRVLVIPFLSLRFTNRPFFIKVFIFLYNFFFNKMFFDLS